MRRADTASCGVGAERVQPFNLTLPAAWTHNPSAVIAQL
jgi:hypothetical protein